MRYVLYARKSSENEDRQVQSIDDQLHVLRELAAARSWEIVAEITESHSAKAPGTRPAFDQMLRQIETRQADAILCWNLNRLSRNPIDSGKLCWLLQTGVLQAIQTPEKPYLPEDNVLLFSVETGMANQYILDLRKAVKRGTDSKLAKGWFPHRAPEGYTNNLREHTIEADPDRFVVLQRAWQHLVAGTDTVSGVVRRLNEDWGYRTKLLGRSGGKKLSRSAGYRLFTNLFYTGYFEHAGVTYKGSHPPMISLEAFREVQARLPGQIGKTHRQKHVFAYTGLMRCGRCGHAVTAEVQSGRHQRGAWTYYHCGNTAQTCSKRSIREDVLEARLNACLRQITIAPELKEIVLVGLERWIKEEFGSQEAQYAQQMQALTQSEHMLNELLEMRLRQLIDDEQYQQKKTELQKTINTLRLQMGWLQERLDRTRQIIADALEFRRTAHEQFLIGDLNKRREIARCLGVRYVLEEGKVYIEMNPLLSYMLPNSIRAQQGNMAEKEDNSSLIEPLNAGSGSTKKTGSCEPVPLGCVHGTEFEPLSLAALFRLVWEGELLFVRQ